MFSPTFDEHGFACPHTVVQVVTDDMPFLPDSLTTELTRHGFGMHIAIHPVFEVERGPDGELLAVLGDDEGQPGEVDTVRESFHHIEIDRQADAAVAGAQRGRCGGLGHRPASAGLRLSQERGVGCQRPRPAWS